MRAVIPFFLLSQLCLAQTILPSFESSHLQEIWVDENLKGNPEEFSVEEYNYNRDSAKLYKSEITRHYYYQNGRLQKIEFRKKGNPIKTYTYDKNSRIIEQLRSDEFESIPRITYSYNDNELTAEEVVYRITGTVHSKTLLRFNDHGQMISREEYRGMDKLNRYWLYSYNAQDDLIEEEYFDLAASLTASANPTDMAQPSIHTEMVYEYTPEGEQRLKKTIKDDLLLSTAEFRHFPDSLVSETIFYQTNGWPSEKHVEVKHDSARVLVKGYYNSGDTTSYRSRFKEIYVDGDLIEYESRTLRGTFVDRYATFYEYDHFGNWIKKTTYSNGVTLKVEQRRIRY